MGMDAVEWARTAEKMGAGEEEQAVEEVEPVSKIVILGRIYK